MGENIIKGTDIFLGYCLIIIEMEDNGVNIEGIRKTDEI